MHKISKIGGSLLVSALLIGSGLGSDEIEGGPWDEGQFDQLTPAERIHERCEMTGAAKYDAWLPGPRPPKPDFGPVTNPIVHAGFSLAPAMSMYVIVDSPHARAKVQMNSTVPVQTHFHAAGDNLMLRVFDADERLVHWQYTEPGLLNDSGQQRYLFHPYDGYVVGVPSLRMAPWTPGATFLQSDFALVGEGVHQIRMHVGEYVGARNRRNLVRVAFSDDLAYGVSFQNGEFSAWDKMPKVLYAYVPPKAQRLDFDRLAGRVVVRNDENALIYDSDTKAMSIAVTKTKTLWKFELSANFQFRASGFPLILATTPQAAQAIEASVEILPDGTVVAHKFQRRIATLRSVILAKNRLGKAENLIKDLSKREGAWLQDPLHNVKYFSGEAYLLGIPHALKSQEVSEDSHWAGAFDGYQTPAGKQPKDHRWDDYRSHKDLAGYRKKGVDARSAAQGLAKAALDPSPVNPYYGNMKLLNRAAAAALLDLMLLQESEVWPSLTKSPSPGLMASPLGTRNLPVFGRAAPCMPADIRAVWTEGVRRMVDRNYSGKLESARNQSAQQLVVFEEFARGTRDKFYSQLSRRFAARFSRFAHPAGWQMENIGPDPSYNGKTLWHMAVYYRMTGDSNILDGIVNAYSFFNKTVAPEPHGGVLGGFNFGHRVGEGFFRTQWSKGRGIVKDLPQVGLWFGKKETPEQIDVAAQEILKQIKSDPPKRWPGALADPEIEYERELDIEPNRSSEWPAKIDKRVTENIANEMIVVKRPGYYLNIYVGKPAPLHAIENREALRLAFESADGEYADNPPVTPFLGGGLSTFWTPAYGVSIMGANWSPLTHHGLVATQNDQKRYWENYHKTSFDLDAATGVLAVYGWLEGQPLKYTRTYRFLDHKLEVELKLEATHNLKLTRLIENFPIVGGMGVKKRDALISAPGELNGEVLGKQFLVKDSLGKGVAVVFENDQQLTIHPQGLHSSRNKYQINRVELDLPKNWSRGDKHTLKYLIQPVTN